VLRIISTTDQPWPTGFDRHYYWRCDLGGVHVGGVASQATGGGRVAMRSAGGSLSQFGASRRGPDQVRRPQEGRSPGGI